MRADNIYYDWRNMLQLGKIMAGLVYNTPVSSMRQFALPLICSLCFSCLALAGFILRADGHSVQKWMCPLAGFILRADGHSVQKWMYPLAGFILRADGHSVQKWICPETTYAVDWALKTNYLSAPGEPQEMYSRHNTR